MALLNVRRFRPEILAVPDNSSTRNDLVLSRAFWFLWGMPMALGVSAIFWSLGRPYLLAVAFTWAGLACVVNAKRCGRFHCHITGPLYLGLGLVSGLTGLGILNVEWNWIGLIFATGTLIAYLAEFTGWRYVRRRPGDGAA